jgi:ferritin-like protein
MAASQVIGEATRRELIARGIAFGRTGGDVGSLRAMVRAEQVLVVTYEQLLAATVFTPAATELVERFLGHERAHVEALARELKRLRGSEPRRPTGLGTTPLLDGRAAVRLLLALERAALHVYYTELARVRDAGVARTAAAIMGNEAQHTTLLRELLSPGDLARAVPAAFVDGER